MPKPFRLGLRRLYKLSPKRVYRFRRKVKRLRIYLGLYSFPADPPSHPALDKLFRRAGKLRQAYINWDLVKVLAPKWEDKAKEEVKHRKNRLKKVLKPLSRAAKQILKEWEKRYPIPWTTPEGIQLWQEQGRRWVEFHKSQLKAFPSPPYMPEQLHELRTLLRRWELASHWLILPELPPEGLTKLLGDARDLYLLHRWMEKIGADVDSLETIQKLYQQKQTEALAQWELWRSS
ncbi:MAG: hypothetical protein ABDH66_06915 [Bacteroidia bacterium]